MQNIRNFSIIAHIDHGKSTLSDRLIQKCGGLSDREMAAQVLDSMDLERERGITIKAQSVTLHYTAHDGQTYQLNFIDTPGHVDFTYEVSRSLCACEGALLVVDAAQGVEAQTVANCYTAIEQDLVVMPVLNKIDLPQADPDRIKYEIEEIIGIETDEAISVSAKTGVGVDELLEAIVKEIPPPEGDPNAPLQALIVDSWFDNYLGVVSLVRIQNGRLSSGDKIQVMSTKGNHLVTEVGIFTPKRHPKDCLECGEVGFIIAGIKDINGAPVGDTITLTREPADEALPGFQTVVPKVFAGLYPVSTDDFEALREALAKLRLNDASLQYEPEQSQALGFGFRCGFLGLLHMEIVQERLEREYQLNMVTTAPTVVYEAMKKDGTLVKIENPSALPDPSHIESLREPFVEANILVPKTYVGTVMTLCLEKRGVQTKMLYIGNQVSLTYEMPLAEVVLDFFDRLKSVSRGYASLDYHFIEFRVGDLVKLDVLINSEVVDSLAWIVHRSVSQYRGRELTKVLKELIPRQMFDVAIQAAIGGQVIARTTVKALRKNVTAKCYGGDVSRKRKLLEKQKAGKKRMKSVGRVDIPQEAFLAVLKVDKDNG